MSGSNDGDVILELKAITKSYSGIVALKKADLKLRRGAVNVLVVENGAGKSTMMRIIAGVELSIQLDDHLLRAFVEGFDTIELKLIVRADVGAVAR